MSSDSESDQEPLTKLKRLNYNQKYPDNNQTESANYKTASDIARIETDRGGSDGEDSDMMENDDQEHSEKVHSNFNQKYPDYKQTESNCKTTTDITRTQADREGSNGEDSDMMENDDQEHSENDSMEMSMFASVWVKVEVGEEDVKDRDLRPSTLRQRGREVVTDDDGSYVPKKRKSHKKREPPTKHLQCDQCDYKTSYKNCLNLHIMGHTNTKPYQCTFCPYTTKYPTSLTRHTIIQHECKTDENSLKQLPTFNCSECDYKTHFKWNLNAHKRKHSLEKKYKCEHCEYTTAYKHNHIKHKRVHSKNDVTFRCDKCPFVTKYEGHISRHLAKIHNEVSDRANRCEKCPFSTKTRWRLNIHRNRSKQDHLLKCIYCDFETYYNCEFKDHKINHYDQIKAAKWVDCLKTENHLSKEYKQKTEDIDFQNKTASVMDLHMNQIPSNLTQHERDNHYLVDPNCEIEWSSIQVNESLDQERPFQCTSCHYTAKFKASVQRHFQRHHTSQNRPYRCLNCDFSTKTKDQISLHNKRSQNEGILQCTHCNYESKFKCQFIMHQRSHYPFKCTLCEYTCRQKYDIQKHFATVHLGGGLKCRYCDYKATRKESLLCHEAIHTGNKPFHCSHCDYKSVRRSLLDNHIRRNHCNKTEMTIIDDNKIQSLKVVEDPEEKAKLEQFAMSFTTVPIGMP